MDLRVNSIQLVLCRLVHEVIEELSVQELPKEVKKVVRVRMEGHASYVGFSTLVVDNNDEIGSDGFLMHNLRF